MKVRPISHQRCQNKNLSLSKTDEEDDKDWPRNRETVRPHTVAVMARKDVHSANKNEGKPRKGRSLILCGCSSRQPVPPSLIETLSDIEKPKLSNSSPLNDVTDLLCGIQSVEITVKQQSSD